MNLLLSMHKLVQLASAAFQTRKRCNPCLEHQANLASQVSHQPDLQKQVFKWTSMPRDEKGSILNSSKSRRAISKRRSSKMTTLTPAKVGSGKPAIVRARKGRVQLKFPRENQTSERYRRCSTASVIEVSASPPVSGLRRSTRIADRNSRQVTHN